MTFEETIDLVNEGILGMHVDKGLAIMAVRSGVPLSSAGKLANLIMVVSPIIGMILAFLVAWWWALIGIAAAIGNFRLAQSECVRSVRLASLQNERLFTLFRERGVISFAFLRD